MSLHFSLRVSPSSELKTIVSVSKKVSKKAVDRNTIKRRVKAIMQKLKLKPATYHISAKVGSGEVRAGELESEIRLLLKL